MALSQHISASLPAERIDEAVHHLRCAPNAAQAVIDLIRSGPSAVPVLRSLLFAREPSGLHEARCRAVDALLALQAYDALEQFLRHEAPIDDPIEKLGEDVVISAAARALARRHDKTTFELLEKLARRRPLTGIVLGLGSYRRERTIPLFVEALAEDEVRITAEGVIRSFGYRARPYLMAAACNPAQDLSESSLRKRRSVLGLLGEMNGRSLEWNRLKHLVSSGDLETAILTAGLGLKFGSGPEQQLSVETLRALRPKADWLRRMQIDQYLQRFRAKSGRDRKSLVRHA